MRFFDPAWMYALMALPVVIFLAWRGVGRGDVAMSLFADADALKKLMDEKVTVRRRRRLLLLSVACGFIVLALMRPQYGVKPVEVKRAGIDLMILIDTSKSMAARDVKPSRMDRAKNEVGKIVTAMEGNRIGVIAFAGDSFIELPLTLDGGAVRLVMDTIKVGAMPSPGTNIAKALDDAVKAFQTSKARTKAVILLTDGESLQGTVEDAAKQAAKAGLIIFPIGIGSESGAPVPEVDDKGNITGYKTGGDGATALSKLDVSTLRTIADVTGGAVYVSQGESLNLNPLVDKLKKMEKSDITSQEFTEYKDRYQILVAVALILLALESALSLRAEEMA